MPKNRKKIGFPMPTAKNRFHILGLHLKKPVIKKNFFDVFLLDLYQY